MDLLLEPCDDDDDDDVVVVVVVADAWNRIY